LTLGTVPSSQAGVARSHITLLGSQSTIPLLVAPPLVAPPLVAPPLVAPPLPLVALDPPAFDVPALELPALPASTAPAVPVSVLSARSQLTFSAMQKKTRRELYILQV
jgi:hypothetical protein